MKIALVQFNPIVGDLDGNVARMLAFYAEADAQGVDLVVFPEMAVTGYPIEDLAESAHFVREAERRASYVLLPKIAETGSAAILFGTVLANGEKRKPSNAAILFDPQTMQRRIIRKFELPNYGVFDEKRIFEPAELEDIRAVTIRGERIGIMICEDAWFDTVTDTLRKDGARAFIAINGSPFECGKAQVRRDTIRQRLHDGGTWDTFIYLNMVGGQDELVFDGGSFAYIRGTLKQFPHFEEAIYYMDTWRAPLHADDPHEDLIESVYRAVVLGTRDYFSKGGFKSAVLGMSGGVDSALVAAIAVDALGADKVHLVRLPSEFSSRGSLDDAEAAASALGANMRTVEIEPVVRALRQAYTEATWDTEHAADVSSARLAGTADENIQARARGNILMAISNQEGHLLLTTGNKSEVSVGYATLYGDMAGGFNPIKDCYKTTVFDMCRWRNRLNAISIASLGLLGPAGSVVPNQIITKPPSAELRPDQKDEDSLPPYEFLDGILKGLIENHASIAEIVAKGHNEATVCKVRRLVDVAEYKRRQAAPGVKITNKLHGRDRRVPIINHFREGACNG